MADCFESSIFMESKIKYICDLQFFFHEVEYSYSLDFLFLLKRENPPLLKIIKPPAIFLQSPDKQLHNLSLECFSSVFFLPLLFHSLLSLSALIAGIVPGIKYLTEIFCCSLYGYDKWQSYQKSIKSVPKTLTPFAEFQCGTGTV